MKTLLAALFAAVALGLASADDKPADKPKPADKKDEKKKDDDKKGMLFTGTWVRESTEHVKITITFKTKTELTVKAVVGDAEVLTTCKYTAEKEKAKADKEGKEKPADKDKADKFPAVAGTIKAEVTKVEVKNDFPVPPEKGYKMQFKLAVAKGHKTAKVTDFDAENKDQVRDVIEGEYKPKKAD